MRGVASVRAFEIRGERVLCPNRKRARRIVSGMTLSSCWGECSMLVFRRCVADGRLRCVEQNFSARCSRKGKWRESPVFRYFSRSRARHEESRDCQTEFAGCRTGQHNRGGAARESGKICSTIVHVRLATYKHNINCYCNSLNTFALYNYMKLRCLYDVSFFP